MKEFTINHGYRGRYFDVRLCAKSKKEAALKLGVSRHTIETYAFANKIGNPYPEIFCKPYGHEANKLFDKEKEYEYEEVKEIINKYAQKQMDILKNQIDEK